MTTCFDCPHGTSTATVSRLTCCCDEPPQYARVYPLPKPQPPTPNRKERRRLAKAARTGSAER
jgi:hypothetical protein